MTWSYVEAPQRSQREASAVRDEAGELIEVDNNWPGWNEVTVAIENHKEAVIDSMSDKRTCMEGVPIVMQ